MDTQSIPEQPNSQRTETICRDRMPTNAENILRDIVKRTKRKTDNEKGRIPTQGPETGRCIENI